MSLAVVAGGLDDARVVALLGVHVSSARASTAPGSAHALDVSGLRAPDIAFWTGWLGGMLAGCAALKRLSAEHGEVKSMHVAEAMRRQGVGSALLRHVIAEARLAGLRRLSLETGSWAFFAPAHALYVRNGFRPCAAFGEYDPDLNSLFFTREI